MQSPSVLNKRIINSPKMKNKMMIGWIYYYRSKKETTEFYI